MGIPAPDKNPGKVGEFVVKRSLAPTKTELAWTVAGKSVDATSPEVPEETVTTGAGTNQGPKDTPERTTTMDGVDESLSLEQRFTRSLRQLQDPLLRYLIVTRRLRLQQYTLPELRDLERAAKLLLHLAHSGIANQAVQYHSPDST